MFNPGYISVIRVIPNGILLASKLDRTLRAELVSFTLHGLFLVNLQTFPMENPPFLRTVNPVVHHLFLWAMVGC
jgi:hypothetical protein